MADTIHGYRILRWGNLSLLYKNGEIRQLCLGNVQVLNAIYAAVRDQNWTTIPCTTNKESIEEGEDGFKIALEVEYAMEKIQYKARISIRANGNKLIYNFDGEAGSSFLRNRIGLCILHPIKECRGENVIITHPDASQSEGQFPELISPHQPFKNISGMQWHPGKGIAATLSFEGEIFESEDQRNWTDASYKTYCTPLDLSFPVQLEKGDQVHQSVSLEVKQMGKSNQAPDSVSTPSSLPGRRVLTIYPGKTHALPGLGVIKSTEESPLTREESEILRTLHFHHYRVDLHLSKKDWVGTFHAAASEQHQLGWPLELALYFGEHPDQELHAFLENYALYPVEIRQIILFDQNFLSPAELLKQLVPKLKATFPKTAMGGGTDANFAEFNRFPPDPDLLDFISYSICPQVHAFDNLTLVENLEAQPDSVSSAFNLLTKPVSIGAITLKQRFNAVATDDEDEIRASPGSDPRQHTSFVAGWTLGSLRNLALAGTSTITYFETVGPRGILSRQVSPEKQSPLYHLFKEILAKANVQVIPTKSSHPLEFDALALQTEKESKLLITNYSSEDLSIEIADPPGTPQNTYYLDDPGWILLKEADLEANMISLEPGGIYKINYAP